MAEMYDGLAGDLNRKPRDFPLRPGHFPTELDREQTLRQTASKNDERFRSEAGEEIRIPSSESLFGGCRVRWDSDLVRSGAITTGSSSEQPAGNTAQHTKKRPLRSRKAAAALRCVAVRCCLRYFLSPIDARLHLRASSSSTCSCTRCCHGQATGGREAGAPGERAERRRLPLPAWLALAASATARSFHLAAAAAAAWVSWLPATCTACT